MTPEQDGGFSEHRLSDRASVELPVEIQVNAFEEPRSGITANVSMLGMFVETFQPEPIGALIKFEMALSAAGPNIRGIGEVVWLRLVDQGPNAPAGMGVKFGHLSDRAQAALRERLKEELKKA